MNISFDMESILILYILILHPHPQINTPTPPSHPPLVPGSPRLSDSPSCHITHHRSTRTYSVQMGCPQKILLILGSSLEEEEILDLLLFLLHFRSSGESPSPVLIHLPPKKDLNLPL